MEESKLKNLTFHFNTVILPTAIISRHRWVTFSLNSTGCCYIVETKTSTEVCTMQGAKSQGIGREFH